MRTIKLAYGVETQRGLAYKVVVVKNSTLYSPGTILDKSEVDTLCAATSWDVTVVRHNPELDR